MGKRILITGGAGFIGSHVADELLAHGHHVRVLDRIDQQVHGDGGVPDYLDPQVEMLQGDVRDRDAVRGAIEGVDAVLHLAAAVGVGQSMYEIERYTGINNIGTAVLLEALIERPVARLVVASSMSIYGEGLYRDADGRERAGVTRTREQLARGDWEPRDELGRALVPIPTPEGKRPELASVYALSKYDQERLCLLIGDAYGIPTAALRFFNVYGPRQALSNPYTGVLAIFAARYLNKRPPIIFEDGEQRRDFVSVHDVAQACRLALESPKAAGQVFNVGSGVARSISEVARSMAAALNIDGIEPEIPGEYRVGDIRHCFADIAHARDVLGFRPRVGWEDGLVELARWLEGRSATDLVGEARKELASRGLTVGR